MRLCPPQAVLERVVLTPSGNLLACWQVAEGADPAELRRCGPLSQTVTPPATSVCSRACGAAPHHASSSLAWR